jgi:hypothetical protein
MEGIMLPEGMRYASKKKARMKKKRRTAPSIPFTFSQSAFAEKEEPLFFLRDWATTLLGFDDFLAAMRSSRRVVMVPGI